MLSANMTEAKKDEIELKDLDGRTLRTLIEYCYTGEIEIRSDNIETLLPAASRYEFVEIEEECSKFLECVLKANPLNCISYYSLAHLYNFSGLKEISKRFACEHFMKVKDSDEFLLMNFQELSELINSDNLIATREEDVFDGVMAWINHDKTERNEHIVKLLKGYELLRWIKQLSIESIKIIHYLISDSITL